LIVTPALAAAWLTLDHDHGSSVCITKVAEFAHLMRDGKWTHDRNAPPVTVGTRLDNGRHRLMAVLVAGVPIDLPVRLK
jgi:hypothetical protein